jgi:hypothetical protein
MDRKVNISLAKQIFSNSNQYSVHIDGKFIGEVNKQQPLLETSLPEGTYTIEIQNAILKTTISQTVVVNQANKLLVITPNINFALVYLAILALMLFVYLFRLITKIGEDKFPNFWLAMLPLVYVLLNESNKKKPNFKIAISDSQ